MLLIICDINLMLNWSVNFDVSSNADENQATAFAMNHTNLYIPLVTLSTQDNAKILQQFQS